MSGAEKERASRNKTFPWKYPDKSSDETLQEKRKGHYIYIAYAIYLGERCVRAGIELAGEMEHKNIKNWKCQLYIITVPAIAIAHNNYDIN